VGRLVEFPLEGGGSVFVEVDPSLGRTGAVTRGLGRPSTSEIAERASETLETALARVQPAAAAIVGRLRRLEQVPDEIEVEFGIQLSAQLGAVVAQTAGEANFSVRLRWRRDPAADA
jgi:hypothetical protein